MKVNLPTNVAKTPAKPKPTKRTATYTITFEVDDVWDSAWLEEPQALALTEWTEQNLVDYITAEAFRYADNGSLPMSALLRHMIYEMEILEKIEPKSIDIDIAWKPKPPPRKRAAKKKAAS